MNLLLLQAQDFIAPDTVRISDRRHRHMVETLGVTPGQPVRAGLVGGPVGKARVVAQEPLATILTVELTEPPPEPLPVTLLLALPRPKVVRRLLQGITAFGVKRLVLVNTARVDKSYWQSPFLADESIREQLLLGLEQARDTQLPTVLLRRRFRPFVEDELPILAEDSLRLVAHPDSAGACPANVSGAVTLAIGPEGGFIPFEIELLAGQGFAPVHLGPRPLRVETALPALLGRLLPL